MEAIEHAAERAASLTQQLLAFGRKQVLQPRIVDLNSIVVDTNKMLHRLIGEHIEVVTVLGSNLWDVQADPGQVEQVLVNLALNARDAMAGGGTLTIRTANVERGAGVRRTRPTGPFVVLSVADSGCGMDAATRARIFEPFFTTKASAGTGLGLASVYGIVAQSGGFIDVTSVPDEGTTMAVYLPRVVRERAELGAPVALPVRATGGETILLAEDEDGVRDAARRMLAAQGYTVLEAFDGAEALTLAAGHSGAIDLLLTDVVMPRKTGPEVAAELLAQRPELKVLYMSGHADEAIMPLALAGTDTAFVQKPFTHDRLAAAVRRAPRPRATNPLGGQLARVLIVDDDPGVCEALRRLVVDHGHMATVAGDATEARAELALGVVRGHPLRREPAGRVRIGARPRRRRGPHGHRRADGQRRRRPAARGDSARARSVRLHRQAVPRQ